MRWAQNSVVQLEFFSSSQRWSVTDKELLLLSRHWLNFSVLEVKENYRWFCFLFKIFLVLFFGRFNVFRRSHWWRFLYGSVINLLSLTLCLFGSSLFSLATIFIFILVFFIYLTVIISFCVEHPQSVLIPVWNTLFYQQQTTLSNQTELFYGQYTGFSSTTFKENIYSNYTFDYTTGDKTRFESIFGVLFSSITGILAGASMSSEFHWFFIYFRFSLIWLADLKKANRSIPNGSIGAIIFAFLIFIIETFFIAATTSRFVSQSHYFTEHLSIFARFCFLIEIFYWIIIFSCRTSTFGNRSSSLELFLLSFQHVYQQWPEHRAFCTRSPSTKYLVKLFFSFSKTSSIENRKNYLGILLRWIRSGTTRQGNPIAAFLFTFALVEVKLLIRSFLINFLSDCLVNSTHRFDERYCTDRHHLLSACLFCCECVLSCLGFSFSTKLSSNVQIFFLAHGTAWYSWFDHHVFHCFTDLCIGLHRSFDRSRCHFTFARISSRILGFNFSSIDLPSSSKISFTPWSTQRTCQILASKNVAARC